MSRRGWLLLWLVACGGGGAVDLDQDGFTAGVDCNDEDAAIHPGADERCDGSVDENCDGVVDEATAIDAVTFYVDADADGYGDDAQATPACVRPEGVATQGGDCDDADPRTRPGAPESCEDPTDYNCDGSVAFADEDGDGTPACEDCDDTDPLAKPDALWFPDTDGDGFGFPVPTAACLPPEGFVANPDDCDDTDPELNPRTRWWPDGDGDGFGANVDPTVVCSPNEAGMVRQTGDCNDAEPSLNPASVWYRDGDGDGFGNDEEMAVQCAPPPGFVPEGGDCDDARWSVSPRTPWFADSDGDGEGDRAVYVLACDPGAGWVRSDTDCDDTDVTRNSQTPWYVDTDGDGFGSDSVMIRSCRQPSGFAVDAGDCDDGDVETHPDADELCDEVDHDCDGDDGLADCADCAALLAADSSLGDGIHTIDPDGAGGQDAFEAYCDMTTDGGGWTRFWWYDAGEGMGGLKDTLGRALHACDSRRDARCYAGIPLSSPEELLVEDDLGQRAIWAFDSSNATSERVLDAFTAAYPDPGSCGDAWDPSWTSAGVPTSCGDDGCACFAYESRGGVWSFSLGGDLTDGSTAFSAGGDASGVKGVDALDSSSRGHSEKRGLQLYWR